MLLAFASSVFLGSESLGTRGHTLLSQIWDFPFRRFRRLAGSRWKYSTTPPHGVRFVWVQVQVEVTFRLTVNQSVSLGVEPRLGLMIRYLSLLNVKVLIFVGHDLWREDGFVIFYMLLALPSVVFLGSETLGTRDRNLLSQTWDFPFRRLLRLAGSRWRYSTPPPHGAVLSKSKSYCDWQSVSQ
jgi:hypothetical protein